MHGVIYLILTVSTLNHAFNLDFLPRRYRMLFEKENTSLRNLKSLSAARDGMIVYYILNASIGHRNTNRLTQDRGHEIEIVKEETENATNKGRTNKVESKVWYNRIS